MLRNRGSGVCFLRSGICLGWFSWWDLQTWTSPTMWIGENHRDVYIDCEAQWLEWIDLDTWYIYIYIYIYIIVVILWFVKFLQDLLDLQISSQWSKHQNDQAACCARNPRHPSVLNVPRQGCNEVFCRHVTTCSATCEASVRFGRSWYWPTSCLRRLEWVGF